MISCGIQCLVCDYPIHLDTYSGCSHACKYCFANEKKSIVNIKPLNNASCLRAFIQGGRTTETSFCDWNIPIHWGANSDPFQECEKEHRRTLECLQVFAETKYPFIVSTKNPVLAATEPYLQLLSECDCVFQISAACSKYDKLETGAPTFKERLQAAEILSKRVRRLIIRVQPYFADCYKDILAEIPNYAAVGAYGIIVEGYATKKKQKGLIKDGKYCFSLDVLAPQYKHIRDVCHENGLRFFCGEDRLRFLGDSLSCCGTEGLDTFKPNTFNVQHLAHDTADIQPCKAMQEIGTTRPFRSRRQSQAWEKHIAARSFEDMMHELGDDYVYTYQYYRSIYGDESDNTSDFV